MSTLKVATIQDTSGNNSSTPAGIASGTAKAWVNFNGTGTVAIRSSFNVSSITDNATGKYTVNFTNAMANASYAGIFTPGGQETSSTNNIEAPERNTAPTTSAFMVLYSNGNQDTVFGQVIIFGD